MMQTCGPHRPDEDMLLLPDDALIYCQEEPLRHGGGGGDALGRAGPFAQQSDPLPRYDSVSSSSNRSLGEPSPRATACSSSSSSSSSGCATGTASSSTTSSPSAVDLELIQLGMRAGDDKDDSVSGFAVQPYELDREMMGMLATNWNLNEQQQQRSAPMPWDAAGLFGPDSALSMAQDPSAAAAMGLHSVLSDVAMLQMLGMGFPGESVSLPTSQRPQQSVAAASASASAAVMAPDAFALSFPDAPVSDYPLSAAATGVYGAPATQAFPAAMGVSIPSAFSPFAQSMSSSSSGSNQQLEPTPLYPAKTPESKFVASLDALGDNQASHDAEAEYSAKRHAYGGPASSSSSTTSSSGHSAVGSSPSGARVFAAGVFIPDAMRTARQQSAERRGGKPKRIRRLCSVPGCGKRARSQDLCIAHGGGRRCIVDGCEKSSQGGNLCIKHGGGKRCRFPGCDKAAQTNSLCKAHGGGPRCQFAGCGKSSQGGGFCRAHGGGKRCAADGCGKGTQRGDFCALHGGSRYCEVDGCTRNDRGGGFCAHHGGGKRCSVAGCSRSCRRNGMCSTHLRLTGREDDGTELEAQF